MSGDLRLLSTNICLSPLWPTFFLNGHFFWRLDTVNSNMRSSNFISILPVGYRVTIWIISTWIVGVTCLTEWLSSYIHSEAVHVLVTPTTILPIIVGTFNSLNCFGLTLVFCKSKFGNHIFSSSFYQLIKYVANHTYFLYLSSMRKLHFSFHFGQVSKVFANGPGDRGSIPGQILSKTQKMVLETSLDNTAL